MTVRWRIGIAAELRTQCLWVRIPLAPLNVFFHSVEVVEGEQNFRGAKVDKGRGTRTGTAAKLKPSRLRVRIPPASLGNIWVDWTWESKLSVKQSLLDEQCRFDSFSAH